jgi:peptidoglycan biosynthesis protein MviN/MurJ (putative lipid II flippase)
VARPAEPPVPPPIPAAGAPLPEPAPPPARSRGADTVLTAVAQVAVLLGAALMGVLIARTFGSSARTDGFFAANAIYGVWLFVAQSLRTTTAAPLVEGGPGFERFREHLGAIVWIFAASVVLAVVVALLAGPVGVAPAARDSFQAAILILCPAAGLQLFAGQAAAMLAALDDYVVASAAYLAGAVVAVAGFVVLHGPLGIEGVPTALAAGAAASALATALALARRGWRPAPPALTRATLRVAGRVTLGAVSLVAAQLVLTVSVAFAGVTGAGSATLYSYAAMAIMLLTAALASPVSIVFAPVVARDWDRRPASLVPLAMTSFRAGALLVGPAVAGLVLLGPQPAGYVLSSLSGADVNRIFDLALILSPSLLGTMLVMVPLVATFAQRRFAELAAWSGAVVAVHAALSALAVALVGGVQAVAAVATLSSLGLAAVPLALVFGRGVGGVLGPALRAVADYVLPAAIGFGAAAALAGFDRSLARGALAFALGGAAYAAWVAVRHRAEVTALVAALRPRRA